MVIKISFDLNIPDDKIAAVKEGFLTALPCPDERTDIEWMRANVEAVAKTAAKEQVRSIYNDGRDIIENVARVQSHEMFS